jgi:hypothetical protein
MLQDPLLVTNQKIDKSNMIIYFHQESEYWVIFNLDNTATIRVGGKGHNLPIESWGDELYSISWNTLYTLLNNMITILITNTFHDRAI